MSTGAHKTRTSAKIHFLPFMAFMALKKHFLGEVQLDFAANPAEIRHDMS